jgi:ubiquitin carboxyl-terminal hydrolase L5
MATESGDDWCTIESDPGVFTELLETLGCTTVELQELWSLDDVDSLEKAYGLIFLFQWVAKDEQSASAQKQDPLSEDEIPADLFFAHQVTTNACATQAILSVVLNAADLELGNTLQEFKSFTSTFPPSLKGEAISSSETIKKTHNSFARQDGFLADDEQTPRRAHEKQEAFHFVAYVPVGGILYELDGLQKGPIVVGAFDDTKKWQAQARAAIQERMGSGQDQVKFNLMAVIPDLRIGAEDQTLAQETAKREQWKLENQRRRHNYVPLCVQLLKELARQDKLPELIQQATDRRQKQKEKA